MHAQISSKGSSNFCKTQHVPYFLNCTLHISLQIDSIAYVLHFYGAYRRHKDAIFYLLYLNQSVINRREHPDEVHGEGIIAVRQFFHKREVIFPSLQN